jgi:hypothetical protein
VLPEFSGQQLACPHCGSPVTIPPFAPQYAAEPPLVSGYGADDTAAAPQLPPSAFAEVRAVDTVSALPPPVQPPPAEPPANDRYPPGFVAPQPRRAEEPKRPDRPAPAPVSEDRYPPGMRRRPSAI